MPFKAIAQLLVTTATHNKHDGEGEEDEETEGEDEAEQLLPVTGKKEIRQSTKQNQKMCQTIAKVADEEGGGGGGGGAGGAGEYGV